MSYTQDKGPSIPEGTYPTDINIQPPNITPQSNPTPSRRETDVSSTTNIKDDSGDVLAAVPDVDVDVEKADGTELKRKISNVIPRTKRRGLFAQLVIGIPEIDDPVQYPRRVKSFIVFIIAMAAIAAPMGYTHTNPYR
jgi:hypothetical protein